MFAGKYLQYEIQYRRHEHSTHIPSVYYPKLWLLIVCPSKFSALLVLCYFKISAKLVNKLHIPHDRTRN